MIFGYARVSTCDQNIESQIEELKKLGAEKIYSDKGSGKDYNRVEFKSLLENLREGDTLVVTKLDRIGRNLKDFISLFEEFGKKSIKIEINSLKLDFTTSEGRMFANLFASIAQFERELNRERTMIGLRAAAAKGRKGGKPKGLSPTAIVKAKKAYELRLKGLTNVEIMAAAEISNKATLYKYIRYHANYLVKTTPGASLSDNGLVVLFKEVHEDKTKDTL